MTFIRDALSETGSLSTDKRRFDPGQGMPYVGAMVPLPPGGVLQSLAVGLVAVGGTLQALKGFVTGDAESALEGVKSALAGTFAAGEINKGGAPSIPVFFQYFPESFEDSRTNEVQTIGIPGLSTPVPTLSNPSPRSISMTVVFSQERWAQAFSGVSRKITEWDKYNFDVALSLQAVRMFAYPAGLNVDVPLIGLSGTFGITPQPLLLTLPNSRIGIESDTITCFLRSYSIEYVSFFPDGQPRLARANLVFEEALLFLSENVTVQKFKNVLNKFRSRVSEAVTDRGSQGRVFGGTRQIDVNIKKPSIPPQGVAE